MKFFTIGYGNAHPERLLAVLKEHEIEAVADVRLRPDKAWARSYQLTKSPEAGIQHLLAREGIRYYSLVELGNLFLGFEDWPDRYRQLVTASGGLLTERLLAISERCCLLCAEKEPAKCHRSIIAEFLVQQGHEVEHLVVSSSDLSNVDPGIL